MVFLQRLLVMAAGLSNGGISIKYSFPVMHNRSYYIINAITLYRLLAAPFLIYLIVNNKPDLFKWLLAISFFTDAIDGFLSRQFHVTSVAGSRMDSIADDFTVIAAMVGCIVLKPEFIWHEFAVIILLLVLLLFQIGLALWRYRKLTSFHTWLAKAATILQGCFLLLLFFLPQPPYLLFYAAAIITALDIAEEIAMVLILPVWQADVKGLYQALKIKRTAVNPD